jgi:hypothetical protein
MERPEFKESDPLRIKMVCLAFKNWMKNNKIELYEVTRAIALIDREEEENRSKRAFKEES